MPGATEHRRLRSSQTMSGDDGAAGTGTATGWAILERDTFAAVVALLEPREVAALACTCRYARGVARDNAMWAPLLARHFGLNVQAPDNAPLVTLFRTLYGACQATAGAAAGGSRGGSCGPLAAGAVQFEGLYTDGGMDMDDPAFWAGNVFQPNGWAIYCSRAGSNVHCIALLKAVRPEDPFTNAHRQQLISVASEVGWLLFLGRVPSRILRRHLSAAAATNSQAAQAGWGQCARLRAAMRRSLSHWSTHGLERLVWQLALNYMGLRNPQLQQQQLQVGPAGAGAGDAAGGAAMGLEMQLMLQLLPPDARSEALQSLGLAPPAALAEPPAHEGAAQAPDGVGAGGGLPVPAQSASPQQRQQQQLTLPDQQGRQPGQFGQLAAPSAALRKPEGERLHPRRPPRQPQPLPPRLAALLQDIVLKRSVSGNRGLVGLAGALEPGDEGQGEGEGEGGGLQVWTRSAPEFLRSAALSHTAAVIDGITVSRTGEFTCPVACGAVFLAQRSPAAGLQRVRAGIAAATAALGQMMMPGGDGGGGGAAESEADAEQVRNRRMKQACRELNEHEAAEKELARREFEEMVRQPYVQALSDLTSLAAVEAAAAAGLLPPVAARGSCPGAGEWVEFERPPPPASLGQQLAGLAAPPPLPPSAVHPGPSGSCAAAAGSGEGEGAGCGGPAPGPAASEGGEGIFWPVVWFRFFPHDGLGDEADQGMALPPVLPPPPPPPLDEQDPVLDGGPEGAAGGGDGAAAAAMDASDHSGSGSDDGDGDGAAGRDDDGGGLFASLDWSDGEGGGNGGGEGVGEGAEEQGGEGEDLQGEEDGSSSETLHSSSSASSDSDGGDGGDGDGGAGGEGMDGGLPGLDTDTEDWENELDFLYGIEGQPYSYTATARQASSDEDDEMAAAVHPYGGADAEGGGGAAGPGPSSGGGRAAAAAAGTSGSVAAGPGREPRGRGNGEPAPLHLGPGRDEHPSPSTHPRDRQLASAADVEGGSAAVAGADLGAAGPSAPAAPGAGTGAGSGADGGAGTSTGGGAAATADASYGSAGEFLTGVPVLTWLNHLTRPNVAGGVLALVADAAGVQALRHTFQDVQTALQPGARVPASATTPPPEAAPPQQQGAGEEQDHQQKLQQQKLALAAAWPPATAAEGGATAAVVGPADGARAPAAAEPAEPAAAAAAAAGPKGRQAPLAVLLPPGESAEHAFEGMEPVPPLLAPPLLPSPPQQQREQGLRRPQAAAGEAGPASAPAAARPPSGHLCMALRQRWAGNAVVFKMIAPEDRSAAFGEEPDTPPNIDVQFLALRGVALALRSPLRLLPSR
ncbi:hypothetical protein PLESTB_000738200 [Pleodorina starrii]|uniref:F-box domain-containing protein n=1 Tax=Pleodorina starrii TaxID=330485 RepID=A0A9W6BKS1_9CHLO|nr:hypothetical protein PLESTM_000186100 [Pleodorina starrii]GLC53377.1 hypothetical protein PLESTB_000738200 [Pleodorina starrii]GLC67153.1 hypothetical protein PLESTF_000522900 [Pleodorina starrii]